MKRPADTPADNVGDNYGTPADLHDYNDKSLRYRKGLIERFEGKPPEINLQKIFFRQYALMRMRSRFPSYFYGHSEPKSIESVAKKLICKATEEKLHESLRLERLLKNGCKEVRYFRFGEIRFVVDAKGDNDVHTVLTVERYQKFVEYKKSP